MGIHPCYPFRRLKRFGNVIHSAYCTSPHLVRSIIQRTDEDHRNPPGTGIRLQFDQKNLVSSPALMPTARPTPRGGKESLPCRAGRKQIQEVCCHRPQSHRPINGPPHLVALTRQQVSRTCTFPKVSSTTRIIPRESNSSDAMPPSPRSGIARQPGTTDGCHLAGAPYSPAIAVPSIPPHPMP